MDANRVAHETAKVLQDYLTYQAVRAVIDQLSETNPPQAIWLRRFSGGNKLQNGEAYLQELMQERKDLVLRILTVREHLAEAVLDRLPAMVRAGMREANLQTRCQILERLTQSQSLASAESPESSSAELDSDDSTSSDEQGSTD